MASSLRSGMLLYVREDKTPNLVSFNNDNSIEQFFLVIVLRKKKWLLSCSYNPHLNFIEKHLNHLKKCLGHLPGKFDNCILLCDFNSKISRKYLSRFSESYNLNSLAQNPTCFKNHDKPICRYLSHKPTTEFPIFLYN